MRDKNGKILGINKTIHIGPYAGGFCTSFGITDDAKVMVHGTDVGGGYVWGENDNQWRHVMTYDTFPALDTLTDPLGYGHGDGMYTIDIAPSNGQIGYCVFRGRLFKTADQFKTLQNIPAGYFPAYPNAGNQRLHNDKLKIDPVDPQTFVVSSEGKGSFYSIDGGATLKKIVGPPDVTLTHQDVPYHCSVAVDRSSATVNGRKQKWSLWVPESGLWETTTGPEGTWTKTTGTPTDIVTVSHMFYEKSGDLYICANGVYRRRSGAWTYLTTYAPTSTAVLGNGQKVSVRYDGTMNWTSAAVPDGWTGDVFWPATGIHYRASHVKWLDQNFSTLFPSKLMADPVDPNKVWMVHGTGICWANPPKDYSQPFVWHDQSEGNAMLVTNDTIMSPDGNLLRAAWDKPIWAGKTFSEINDPATYFPKTAQLQHGWSIDWIPGHPDWLVFVVNNSQHHTGISKDGGKTYKAFSPHPNGWTLGGNIGFVNDQEGYWIPANNGKAVSTIDGGASWQIMQLTAKDGVKLPSGGEQGWSQAHYFRKKNLLISKEEPGVAYLWNYGPDAAPSIRGLWKKEAGSTTFNQVYAGAPGTAAWYYYFMKLLEVPGRVGDIMLISGGSQDGHPGSARSIDGGKTWQRLKTTLGGVEYFITDCEALGFGKGPPENPYPAIRYAAQLNGEYGIWESLDNLATSQLVEKRPAGLTQGVSSITGHPNQFGVWYYGVGQLGWVMATKKQTFSIS